ncbi:cell division topological specificity factor MinE [Deinococcus soli (ex Cha et al. 2016)]|uniref:Cell division topological specificity factor n=2 Tax=Deinococcus soli (ex Cha et al. 2016) TaxID=1309411 RepID=A0ACC6KFE8_9DEIO|nr:cell division topological specificity factor MinE [Deinococcus soli (ex Cha et al. 2016)]MDR6218284.1 cell division topological specificity factor [Deinococcus soli (ex Cha et al. 2016)]MDR6329024.1 cell division topological specificity factor [Deinococcus soli (ex Cha et al. 2016)]MDR6751297.1 cell division topological specificity factor [Deinococcus soli (ex Cha et al. 2016)]
MFEFLRGKKPKDTKETLKDRLQIVLSYDRAKIEPGKVEALRQDLMAVLEKYFPAQDGAQQLEVEQREGKLVLVAHVPIQP